MDAECVSETSEVFKQLTRLSAREEFMQFVAVKAWSHVACIYICHGALSD
jgi:hypothetical protein